MKITTTFLLSLLLFLTNNCPAQKIRPEKASLKLNEALISRDQKELNKLLHTNLSYGHSNLWIEDKTTLIQNNLTSTLVYKKISCDSIWSSYSGKTCILRYRANIEGFLKSNEFNLNLYVVQVWVKKKSKWKLLARQSTKIN
ncbi:MAG: DUF4440 domain-containing protein [Saprospiraceae bacterium]